ncbi:MAG: NAD-dependent epimerase/dehydratase family protein, partial [Ignavibacteria bacterium]|nr:NAD-dependent epimerase/dehydratase family protein [Ignavibacteria bacterium]
MAETAKVLITGSSGFVGSNLIQTMKDDYELFGLDIKKGDVFDENHVFNWHELGKIPNIDVIIHLAGKAHDTKNTTSDQEYFDVNLGLTQKIFDFFLLSQAKTFIFFSSVKAVADTVEGDILSEDSIPVPQSPYGKSKLAAEQYILSKKIPEHKSVYIIRPCMIHGPGNKGNLNLLFSMVQKGIPWPLGAFNNQRSFASIDNVTYIIHQILEQNIPSGIY